MTPTLEEVKKVAVECGAIPGRYLQILTFGELQAFAQYYKEEGRKEQRQVWLPDLFSQPCLNNLVTRISNNTGE